MEELKITRYLSLYRRNLAVKENIEQRKKMRKRISITYSSAFVL